MPNFEDLQTNAEAFGILREISNLLNTGLENEELLLCFKALEDGADPTGLALVVQQLKQEASRLRRDNLRAPYFSTLSPLPDN